MHKKRPFLGLKRCFYISNEILPDNSELVSASHMQGVHHEIDLSRGILKQVQDDYLQRIRFFRFRSNFARFGYFLL
jgi:hypothetical protein